MELEVLKAIETQLPLNIPIRSFFDLIVGTRFVHRISLLGPTKYPRRVFIILWMHSNLLQSAQLFHVVRYPDTDTVIVAQEGLLHWDLESKDGQLTSVSTILRSFAALLSPLESSMVYGDSSSCPP